MLAAAAEYFTHLSGVSWVHPEGGLYVWMSLPAHIDTGFASPLFERAVRYRNMSARFRPRSRDKAGEHRALMKAVVGRDADRACELIAKHIQNTTDNVIKYASELFSQN